MLKQTQIDFNSPHFHNSIGVEGKEREAHEVSAISLEQFILDKVFKPGLELSPYDVIEICKKLGRPVKENSVRRALTNLKDPELWDPKTNERTLVLTGKQIVNKKYSPVKNATYKLR